MIADELVEPALRALLGRIAVDDGPTDEQLALLRAVVEHLWGREDLALFELTPLEPGEAAALISSEADRRRVKELMVTLELCRHPESIAEVRRVEAYAEAFGEQDQGLEVIRRWIQHGTQQATADFDRFYGEQLETLSEPTLRHDYLTIDMPDLKLAERLAALHDLPSGTLGHAYVEFYRRNGIALPGADVHTPAHYVSHDMNHVISGYEPTGPGEIVPVRSRSR